MMPGAIRLDINPYPSSNPAFFVVADLPTETTTGNENVHGNFLCGGDLHFGIRWYLSSVRDVKIESTGKRYHMGRRFSVGPRSTLSGRA